MKKRIHIMIIVTILLLSSNITYGSNIKVDLIDVQTSDWYMPTISKLVNLGGIEGYPDKTFKPNKPMTKAEFVKTLVTSLGLGELSQGNDHWASGYIGKAESIRLLGKNKLVNIDKPISRLEAAEIAANTLTYLKEVSGTNLDPISIVSSSGIMTGYPDGSFKGDNSLTRAEASTIIVRILEKDMRVLAVKKSVDVHSEILRLVNIERKKANLEPIIICPELSKVAELKSKDMAVGNYFDHTSPTYGTPFNMMNQFGIEYKAASENIAKGYKTAEDVVKGWMNSPGHRKNILNPHFNKMGIGLYTADVSYWTQMFTN